MTPLWKRLVFVSAWIVKKQTHIMGFFTCRALAFCPFCRGVERVGFARPFPGRFVCELADPAVVFAVIFSALLPLYVTRAFRAVFSPICLFFNLALTIAPDAVLDVLAIYGSHGFNISHAVAATCGTCPLPMALSLSTRWATP